MAAILQHVAKELLSLKGIPFDCPVCSNTMTQDTVGMTLCGHIICITCYSTLFRLGQHCHICRGSLKNVNGDPVVLTTATATATSVRVEAWRKWFIDHYEISHVVIEDLCHILKISTDPFNDILQQYDFDDSVIQDMKTSWAATNTRTKRDDTNSDEESDVDSEIDSE